MPFDGKYLKNLEVLFKMFAFALNVSKILTFAIFDFEQVGQGGQGGHGVLCSQ